MGRIGQIRYAKILTYRISSPIRPHACPSPRCLPMYTTQRFDPAQNFEGVVKHF